MERQQRIRIVANRLYDEVRLARTALRRLLDPMPNSSADSALVIEQQDWRGLRLRQSGSFHDSNGCVTAVMTLDTVGCGPSTRPTSFPFRNIIKVGVPRIS